MKYQMFTHIRSKDRNWHKSAWQLKNAEFLQSYIELYCPCDHHNPPCGRIQRAMCQKINRVGPEVALEEFPGPSSNSKFWARQKTQKLCSWFNAILDTSPDARHLWWCRMKIEPGTDHQITVSENLFWNSILIFRKGIKGTINRKDKMNSKETTNWKIATTKKENL